MNSQDNSEAQKSKINDLGEPANGAVKPKEREDETPTSILEKGIIYFFFRGRVGIECPSSVDEVARSYMVLRPLPHGAKLGEGSIGDAGNCRLLALPKKVLPVSGKDRFMVFVEKTQQSFKDLKIAFCPLQITPRRRLAPVIHQQPHLSVRAFTPSRPLAENHIWPIFSQFLQS